MLDNLVVVHIGNGVSILDFLGIGQNNLDHNWMRLVWIEVMMIILPSRRLVKKTIYPMSRHLFLEGLEIVEYAEIIID